MQSHTHSTESAALRVLVVDDHPDLLSMLDLMMQRRQYAVRTALSASEALQLASDFAPHVVISDIGMPGMDGYEMMEAMRGQPQFGPFRAIALTGYDLKLDGDRAKQAGYDAHLPKPIEFDQLFEMIENLASEINDA